MAVENILVQECVITKKNVSEYILFADSKCCPLLKEYALSYFLLHYKELFESDDSQILRDYGKLLSELVTYSLMGSSSDVGVGSMGVAQLRKEEGVRQT
jgi:hypothetical protein